MKRVKAWAILRPAGTIRLPRWDRMDIYAKKKDAVYFCNHLYGEKVQAVYITKFKKR